MTAAELACDERVVRALDGPGWAAYTQALLPCSIQKQAVTACPPAFDEVGVKTRIKSLLMLFLRKGIVLETGGEWLYFEPQAADERK